MMLVVDFARAHFHLKSPVVRSTMPTVLVNR